MNEYRISKYNPKYRDAKGCYCNVEWNYYSDIGTFYNGELFTLDNYIDIENKYINAIISIMNKMGIKAMTITRLERHNDSFDTNTSEEMIALNAELKENCLISILKIPALCKLILREYIWAKLTSHEMFVHFSDEYYMYIGINDECSEELKKIEESGLFVEQHYSPYKTNEYRITKYNPEYRNAEGHYCKDEWTSYSDIGTFYNSELFSLADYINVENKYINAIITIMNKMGINSMTINGLERCVDNFDINTSEEMIALNDELNDLKGNYLINISKIPALCKLILREYIWGNITSPNMFVHFGYDYYMYVGINGECSEELKEIEESGLFVEQFQSPYRAL